MVRRMNSRMLSKHRPQEDLRAVKRRREGVQEILKTMSVNPLGNPKPKAAQPLNPLSPSPSRSQGRAHAPLLRKPSPPRDPSPPSSDYEREFKEEANSLAKAKEKRRLDRIHSKERERVMRNLTVKRKAPERKPRIPPKDRHTQTLTAFFSHGTSHGTSQGGPHPKRI